MIALPTLLWPPLPVATLSWPPRPLATLGLPAFPVAPVEPSGALLWENGAAIQFEDGTPLTW